ncbi:hypothetical protein T492DRAFT_860512 [Pavlovales sp. CCMP2436]|nr:hypothetical protein T492DRAFT_860512 [Pavlovales sp. CCMP2436]
MAGYSAEMARVGAVVEQIDAASAEGGREMPRALKYAFTATLPPCATNEAIGRLRLSSGGLPVLVLRFGVDRADLFYTRLLLVRFHDVHDESLVALGVHTPRCTARS